MKTNADIFLKDDVSIKDLTNAMVQYSPIRDYIKKDTIILDLIEMFFEEEENPVMSEDEKCILKNLGSSFDTIFRTAKGDLGIRNKEGICLKLNQFKDHLFQSIEKGYEYDIESLLK